MSQGRYECEVCGAEFDLTIYSGHEFLRCPSCGCDAVFDVTDHENLYEDEDDE